MPFWKRRPQIAAPQLELFYPLYLDIPMIISFLAALEDGVSYDTKVSRWSGRRRSLGLEAKSLAGIGVGLRGGIDNDQSEEHQLIKRHTETSLFIRLREALFAADMVASLDSESTELADISPGTIVEIIGTVAAIPLESLIRVSERSAQLKQNDQWPILERVKSDLEATGIMDVILYVGSPSVVTGVLTVRRDFGAERCLDGLLDAEARVLGKVTRVTNNADYLRMSRRSILSWLSDEDLRSLFGDLDDDSFLKYVLIGMETAPPYVQILPLAIFV